MSDHATRPVPPTTYIADIATHAARMDEPLVSFRQIQPATRSPAPAPSFLFGPSTPAQARALYGQIETPELGCYAIADAAIAPTGIALKDTTAFASPTLNLPTNHVSTITRRLAETTLPVRYATGPLVPLFGPAEESQTQLIIDYLPRLWLLEQAGYALKTLQFLIAATLPPHVETLLAALAIPPEQLVRYAHWEEIIRTDLLILPTILRQNTRLSPHFANATQLWTTRVRTTLDLPVPAPENRIYLATQDGPANRTSIEAIAATNAYQIIQPDILDLPAQARLFSQASHIVGTPSPALLNTVFSAPGTRICILQDPQHTTGFLHSNLGAALRHTIGYVFTDPTGCIDEADFRRGLEVLALQ